jgi:molybdopterin-binding protein
VQLLRLPEAARQMGISYPTLKQWIYKEKIRTVQTPGGHHRVPRSEVDRLLFRRGKRAPAKVRTLRAVPPVRAILNVSTGAGLEHVISGRNQLVGRVIGLKVEGLLAKVVLDIGGQTMTSIITRDACRDLGLKVGDTAAALVKATEVMVMRVVQVRS